MRYHFPRQGLTIAWSMGLDAVVYRNKANLPFDADIVGAVVDETTGEYYFPDQNLEPALEREFPRETRIAVQKRIGNIALVAALRRRRRANTGGPLDYCVQGPVFGHALWRFNTTRSNLST
jgi:hypothetical protein